MQFVYIEKGSVSEIPLEMKLECFILATTFVQSRNILESIDTILIEDLLTNKGGPFMLKLKSSVKKLLKQRELFDIEKILSSDDLMFFNGISETKIDQLDHLNSLKLLDRLLNIISYLHLHRSKLPLPEINVNIFFS
jgi:hypothetical protein